MRTPANAAARIVRHRDRPQQHRGVGRALLDQRGDGAGIVAVLHGRVGQARDARQLVEPAASVAATAAPRRPCGDVGPSGASKREPGSASTRPSPPLVAHRGAQLDDPLGRVRAGVDDGERVRERTARRRRPAGRARAGGSGSTDSSSSASSTTKAMIASRTRVVDPGGDALVAVAERSLEAMVAVGEHERAWRRRLGHLADATRVVERGTAVCVTPSSSSQ